MLEIDRLRHTPVIAMSSGMRQRLALHLAFLGDPAVVLLDEPFNWLDPVAAYDLKEELGRYARSAVLITPLHDVATFATRRTAGLLLREGSVGRSFRGEDLERAAIDVRGFRTRAVQRPQR